MSPQQLHNSLLRPPIIQILRAAGFHSARPAVIDALTDLAARYLLLLASSAADHARNSHEDVPTPGFADVLMALQDVGALRPQIGCMEEHVRGEEDLRGLENFLGWFNGPVNKEIKRVAGFVASAGDVVDADSLEKEDYLSCMCFRWISLLDTYADHFSYSNSLEEEAQQNWRGIQISGHGTGKGS
jgi:transcription initiation factor TFIID subunit 3